MSDNESRVEISSEELDRICQEGSGISVVPSGFLRLFDKVDEVVKVGTPNEIGVIGSIRTKGNLERAEEIFKHHFLGRPIIPGTTLMDQLFQLAGLYAAAHGIEGNGFALEFSAGKFLRMVTPETKELFFEVDILRFHVGKLKTKVKGIGRVYVDKELAATPLEIDVFIHNSQD